MTPESFFSIANSTALAGWILLIFLPNKKWASTYVAGRAIPLLLACLYLAILALHGRESQGSFNTLAGVTQLFQSQWLLLAGWIHYLTFDLFIGAWEVRDAKERGIHRLLVLPCLILTFLFGPVGLLSYFTLRSLRRV